MENDIASLMLLQHVIGLEKNLNQMYFIISNIHVDMQNIWSYYLRGLPQNSVDRTHTLKSVHYNAIRILCFLQ